MSDTGFVSRGAVVLSSLSTQRIQWVDIFKGIVIFLMVMGHSSSPLFYFIYLFHMPAFLFIAGYTTDPERYAFLPYLKRKTLGLLLPFLAINLVFLLLCFVLAKTGLYVYFYEGPFHLWERLHTFFRYGWGADLGGATWFLVVLFTVEVLFKAVQSLTKAMKGAWLLFPACLILFLCGERLIHRTPYLDYFFDLSLYGLLYFALGVAVRRFRVFESRVDHGVTTVFCMVVFLFLGGFYHPAMNWPTRAFDSTFINLLGALSGIYLTYRLSVWLEHSSLRMVFQTVGQRTFAILVLHFLVFRLTFVGLYLVGRFDLSYLRQLTPRPSTYLWLPLTLSTTAICVLLSQWAQKNRVANFLFNARLK